ncbi:MAG: class I SAM-dependent methyltransferase, partial [Planctomycetota bacterium]
MPRRNMGVAVLLVSIAFSRVGLVGCQSAGPSGDGTGPAPKTATARDAKTDAAPSRPAAGALAKKVLSTAGVKGGLIVHLGCGDGELTAALRVGEGFLVHGLDTDAAKAAKARERIRALGLYGAVTVDTFDGRRLPFIDNLVNLVVAEDLGDVPMDEVMRALCPRGVACVMRGGAWSKTVKPWPAEIDEWTHYMRGPEGNGVANDTVIGPPRRVQWVGSPRWARSHEHTASLHALVSARGRIFFVMDDGPRASIQLPSKYTLTARDAFNGVTLWKRDLPDWYNHLYPLKSGPAYMPRRLVAVGETVYVSPGVGHGLLALDAATGKLLREYENTTTTTDIAVCNDTLFVVVDPDRKRVDYRQQASDCWRERDRASNKFAWRPGPDKVKAFEAASAKLLWEKETPAAPMTLATDGARVCLFDG